MPLSRFEQSFAAVSTALALSIGASACTSQPSQANRPAHHTTAPENSSCDTTVILTGVRVEGPSKEGGLDAVNSGNCVSLYSRDTLRNIGQIAHGADMRIVCFDGPKPQAFEVEAKTGLTGDVNLSPAILEELHMPGVVTNFSQPVGFEDTQLAWCR